MHFKIFTLSSNIGWNSTPSPTIHCVRHGYPFFAQLHCGVPQFIPALMVLHCVQDGSPFSAQLHKGTMQFVLAVMVVHCAQHGYPGFAQNAQVRLGQSGQNSPVALHVTSQADDNGFMFDSRAFLRLCASLLYHNDNGVRFDSRASHRLCK